MSYLPGASWRVRERGMEKGRRKDQEIPAPSPNRHDRCFLPLLASYSLRAEPLACLPFDFFL